MNNNSIIKVYGHVRSGNNYLCQLLLQNFYVNRDLGKEISRKASGHWSRQKELKIYAIKGQLIPDETVLCAYYQLVGSHKMLPVHPKQSIYIYRDGRDVALSLFHWKQCRQKEDENITFSEFIRTPLDWFESPGYKKNRSHPSLTIFEHWKYHIEYYLQIPDLLFVCYEDLVEYPNFELQRIINKFSLIPEHDSFILVNKVVGWHPTSINIAKWKTEMNNEDNNYFYEVIGTKFIDKVIDRCQ